MQTSLKFVYSENNSLSVIFHDNNLLMGVVGEFNKNYTDGSPAELNEWTPVGKFIAGTNSLEN